MGRILSSGLYMMISASFTRTVGLQGTASSDLYNSVIVAIPSKRDSENGIGTSHHGQAGAAASVTDCTNRRDVLTQQSVNSLDTLAPRGPGSRRDPWQ